MLTAEVIDDIPSFQSGFAPLEGMGMVNIVRLSFIAALLVLSGCGGVSVSPFTPPPPPSGAQVLTASNITVSALPLDIVYCTRNGSTPGPSDRVLHVIPNYPIAGQATFVFNVNAVCNHAGIQITIFSTQLVATTANNGTYTTISATLDAQSREQVVVACTTCVQFDDDPGFYPPAWTLYRGPTVTFDGFPAAVKDGNGRTHVIFTRGIGTQGQNPGDVTETTTLDGLTYTAFNTIAHDSSNGCTQTNFSPPPATFTVNCTYGAGAIGTFANGDVNVLLIHEDVKVLGVLDITDTVYDIHTQTWGTPQTNVLPNPAPDGSAWAFVIGPMYMYNNDTMACNGGFLSGNGNLYFGCNCDMTGGSWGLASCNGGFHQLTPAPPTNEGSCNPGDTALRVFCIYRTNATVAGACATPPCGTFDIYTSEDLGHTWTLRVGSIGATAATGSWELVWPIMFCPSSSLCELIYGERDTTTGRMMIAPISVPDLFKDAGNIGTPLLLDPNIPAPSDCCYGSISGLTPSEFYMVWYEQFAGWKLFYGTASYTSTYGIHTSGFGLANEVVR